MKDLSFLSEAFEEARALVVYYESCTKGLGVRLRLQIEAATASIIEHPLVWRERSGGYRRVNLPGFPVYIAYFIRGERLIVAAVGHASRDPDFWKRRVRKIEG